MVKLLKKMGTTTNIKLMFKDARTVDYSKLDYDFVLTSPPYYNVEIYDGTTEMTDEKWESTFYIPLFSKTFKHLKTGGHYVLNIPQKLYESVCVDLFGKADLVIPLHIKNRPKNMYTVNDYHEFIYAWKK